MVGERWGAEDEGRLRSLFDFHFLPALSLFALNSRDSKMSAD